MNMRVKDIIKDSIWIPGRNYRSGPVELSILLPTFRRLKSGMFEACVESLLGQSFSNFELIIIDDCSVDGTFERIMKYMERDGRISCIRHAQNIGLPAISEFEGYLRSTGLYIGYAFDDCVFEVDAYDNLLREIKAKNANVVFGYASYNNVQGEREYLGRVVDANSLAGLWMTNFIPNCGVVIRRELLELVGHYDPHVSLIRLCDWDLWRRIIKKTSMIPVDVYVAHEHGTVLNDSLGNSFELNFQVVFAQMARDRTRLLSTSNFLEYDVISIVGQLSIEARDAFYGLIKRDFENRFWCNRDCVLTDKHPVMGDILIVSDFIDACVLLYFDGLEDNILEKIYHVNSAVVRHSPEILACCGCVIIVRNLENHDLRFVANLCFKSKVPVYYYLDDNFFILAESNLVSSYYCSQAFKDLLRSFDGVIVSSQSLYEYIIQYHIHNNCIILQPVYRDDIYFPKLLESSCENVVTIAFMGGSHRVCNFVSIVLPAIKNISADANVRLLLPDFFPSKAENDYGCDVIFVPFQLNYDDFIRSYYVYGPDIVLHINSKTSNNKFKTVNALLNATLVGAALVASNDDPYIDLPDDVVALADNKIDSWERKIRELVINSSQRFEQISRARQFCKLNYSSIYNSKILRELSLKHSAPNAFDVRIRCRRLINFHVDTGSGEYINLGFLDTCKKIKREFGYLVNLIRDRGLLHYLTKFRALREKG